MNDNEAKEFEQKWHNKIVRPKGGFYKIPIKNYTVTAALYEFESNGDTVFAIMAEDYDIKTNKHWFTIKIALKDLEKSLGDFEIVGE